MVGRLDRGIGSIKKRERGASAGELLVAMAQSQLLGADADVAEVDIEPELVGPDRIEPHRFAIIATAGMSAGAQSSWSRSVGASQRTSACSVGAGSPSTSSHQNVVNVTRPKS